jgi:hypothetical protein
MPTLSGKLINLLELGQDKKILHLLKTGDEDIHLNYQQLLDGAGKYAFVLSEMGVNPY